MYLNTAEINSALVGLENAYPQLCRRIQLPHRTHEGRTCFALRIGKDGGLKRGGILFTGCVHAREWGGADICVYFAADVLEAYQSGTGLHYGGKSFSASQIVEIVEQRDIFVFPCVNPDGRHYSMTSDYNWRKNRNPASSGGAAWKIGVDINRNFDFMWDFPKYFHPNVLTWFSMPSADPASDNFHGVAPHSEPETRNVVWLFDQFPEIQWFMDIHSYTGTVLYPWGDAPNQTTDPSRNFLNPAFDGKRGLDNPAIYGEYIAGVGELAGLANAVRDAIAAVRGESYSTNQSFYLQVAGGNNLIFPSCGTSDDYAYSRHLTGAHPRISSFTLEFYKKKDFNPPWAEMEPVIAEIDAGLVEFCLLARHPLPFDPDKWAKSVEILFGIINDGGGIQITPGGRPIPVPPLDPWVRDILSGLLIYHLAQRMESGGPALKNQALNAIEQAVQKQRAIT